MSRMSLREVLDPLASWSSQGKPAALATLIRAQRSAPRRPGARFAVTATGDLAGSVSSGCIEGDLHEHLQQILGGADPRRLTYGITDEMAAEVGLACGGEIEVFAERFVSEDPVWPALRRAVSLGLPALLLTGVSGTVTGRRLLAFDDAESVGTLGSDAVDRELTARAGALFETPGTLLLEVPPDLPGEEADAEEANQVFAEALLPPPSLAIVGASLVAAALCHLASFVGFAVTVIDPRPAFLTQDKFPDALRLLECWPDEGLEEMGLDRFTSVVVLAHDRKLDVPALEAALRAGCRYVGQIGGKRTQRLRREALAAAGLEEAVIANVRGPVGLDIGSETPEEIALAILAEMIAVRQGKG